MWIRNGTSPWEPKGQIGFMPMIRLSTLIKHEDRIQLKFAKTHHWNIWIKGQLMIKQETNKYCKQHTTSERRNVYELYQNRRRVCTHCYASPVDGARVLSLSFFSPSPRPGLLFITLDASVCNTSLTRPPLMTFSSCPVLPLPCSLLSFSLLSSYLLFVLPVLSETDCRLIPTTSTFFNQLLHIRSLFWSMADGDCQKFWSYLSGAALFGVHVAWGYSVTVSSLRTPHDLLIKLQWDHRAILLVSRSSFPLSQLSHLC